MKCAVIGAGIAGLVCARILREHGLEVIVYDKGRHVGGRLASRDRDADRFDYGAQYFTARDPIFKKQVDHWLQAGIVAEWVGNFARLKHGIVEVENVSSPRYVGVPNMRAVAENLVRKTEVRTAHRIDEAGRLNGKWFIAGAKGFETTWDRFAAYDYDYLVLNMPPSQAAELVPSDQLNAVKLEPCWTVMLTFSQRLDVPYDAAYVHGGPLSWVALDSSKPGRPDGDRWVLQAAADWSLQNIDMDAEAVVAALREEFARRCGASLPVNTFDMAHKWLYAKPVNALDVDFIYDSERSIGYCGDWCQGARVENAFVSGTKLAESILATCARDGASRLD